MHISKQNEYITVYDEVFDGRELHIMDAWFAQYLQWGLGYDNASEEQGASSATLCRSLKWDMWGGYHALLDDIQNLVRERLKENFDVTVPYFSRCLINNFRVGDCPMFHQDNPTDNGSMTYMVYPNKVWQLNWGGCTLFAKDGIVVDAINPAPGRVIAFPGILNHCGQAPTKYHQGYGRFSIAYQSTGFCTDKSELKASAPKDVEQCHLLKYYGNDYRRLV